MHRSSLQWGLGVVLLTTLATAPPVKAAVDDINVGGRIHFDLAVHDNDDTDFDDAVLLRRARLGADGRFGDGWAFKAEYDFAENDVAARDVYLSYTGLGPGTLRIGQFKVPFSLNEMTSSNSITFIERSLATEAFSDAFRLGIDYGHFAERYGYRLMSYARRIGDDVEGDQPIGIAGRFTFNPIRDDDAVVHLGVAMASEASDDTDEGRFRARPEARPGTDRLVDTGAIGEVDRVTKLGLEAAALLGPFSIEGEYMRAFVTRDGQSNRDFDGYHLQLGYVFGGTRPYRDGRFATVRADNASAWELAARVSRLDLNDGPIAGGEQTNVTLALNWYASSRVRVMGNVIRADQDDSGQTPHIFLLRAQVSF